MSRTFQYVDLFPDEPGPRRSPMDAGGEGMFFVYLTNRNACSMLFRPRAVDAGMTRLLDGHFPMGYSTLFVLEKLAARPSRLHSGATGRSCVVFVDPLSVSMGSGATQGEHASHAEALASVRERRKAGVRCILTHVIHRISWH